jgi:nucleolin
MSSSDSSSDSESEIEEQTPVKATIEQDDSSSDSSSDEAEEETAKPAAKKEDSSSDSDSDSDEEAKAKEPVKKAEADSDESSDSSSDEEEEAPKKAEPAKAEEDSSDDSSDDEAEEEVKPKATPAESSDSSDSDGEGEEEKPKEAEKETEAKEASKEVEFMPTKSKNPVTILFEWQIGKEDATPRKRKLSTPSLPVAKKPTPEKSKPAAAAASVSVTIEKEFNPDDFRSADLKDQTDTVFVKGIDVNAFEKDIEAFFTEKVAKPVSIRHKWEEDRPGLAWITFATNEQASKAVIDCNGEYIKDRYVFTDWAKPKTNSGGGKRSSGPRNAHLKDTTNRCWVGNLHREVDRDALWEFFKGTAEATDVYILAGDGSRPQIAFVSFETNEIASKIVEEFQNSELLGNYLRLDWAEPRRDNGGGRGTKRKQELSEKPEGCVTCFVGRLSDNVDDDKLTELFKDAGEIERIRYMERDGEFKGVAFVQFVATESTDKAVLLNGTSFLGKPIRVDFAADRKKREY